MIFGLSAYTSFTLSTSDAVKVPSLNTHAYLYVASFGPTQPCTNRTRTLRRDLLTVFRARFLHFFSHRDRISIFSQACCLYFGMYNSSSHPYGRTAMSFTLSIDMLHTHDCPQLSLLRHMKALELMYYGYTLRMSSLENRRHSTTVRVVNSTPMLFGAALRKFAV